MNIYTIQVHINGQWLTAFCGRMPCSLRDLLISLAVAMPKRRLTVAPTKHGTLVTCF